MQEDTGQENARQRGGVEPAARAGSASSASSAVLGAYRSWEETAMAVDAVDGAGEGEGRGGVTAAG